VYDNPNGTQEARRVFRPHWTNSGYTSVGSFSMSKPATHFDGMNTLYLDGHVKWQKLPNLFKQLCPEWTVANTGNTDCTAPSEIN
jgi:prepilin-type processing-associated H-X9-DG protein